MRGFLRTRHGIIVGTALALPLGLLLVCASLLAVSPILHHLAHADAGRAAHECMATLLAKGDLLGATVGGTLMFPALRAVAWPVRDSAGWVFSLAGRLQGSRAPPPEACSVVPS